MVRCGPRRQHPYDKISDHLVKYKSISVTDAYRLYGVELKVLSKMISRFKKEGMIIEKEREYKFGKLIGVYKFLGMEE